MTNNGKLTPEITQQICTLISQGIPNKTAAQTCGICESTFYSWLQRGQEVKSGKYLEFLESIKKAEAQSIADSVQRIKKAGEKQWTALAWLLERRHPNEWGNKQNIKMEHTGKITFEQYRELLKEDE